MIGIEKPDQLKVILKDVKKYCNQAVLKGDSYAIRQLSGELILHLNRANRRLEEHHE